MGDPNETSSLRGVEQWWDGRGDPKRAPKYLQALDMLNREGTSEQAKLRLHAAIDHYDMITEIAGKHDDDTVTPVEVPPKVAQRAVETAQQPAAEPAPDLPWWEVLSKLGNRAMDKATLGWAPRYLGFGARLGSDAADAGIKREYSRSGPGDEAQSIAASQRAENARTGRDYPGLSALADTVGMAAPATAAMMLAPGAFGLAIPEGVAASIGAGALVSGAYGTAEGAAESAAPSAAGQLREGLERGYDRAGWGALMSGGLAAGGAGSSAVGRALQRLRNTARGTAAGGLNSTAAIRALEDKPVGVNTVGDLGQAVEDLGLPRKRWWGPMSAHDYEVASREMKGPTNAAIEDAVNRTPGSVPNSDLQDAIVLRWNAANSPLPNTTDKGRSYTRTIEDQLDELRGKPPDLSPATLLALKRQYTPNAYVARGEVTVPGTTPSKEAYADLGDASRHALSDLMERNAAPEDAAAFAKGNSDYTKLSAINELSRQQAHRQSAAGIGRMMRDAAGMFAGEHAGGLPGMAAGLAITEGVPHYGADVAATLAKNASSAASGVGTALSAAGRPEMAGSMDRLTEGDSGVRGQMLPSAAWHLYQTDPAALGPYAPQLLDARRRGEGQFAAELERLEEDPAFMRDVMPKIRALAAREE